MQERGLGDQGSPLRRDTAQVKKLFVSGCFGLDSTEPPAGS